MWRFIAVVVTVVVANAGALGCCCKENKEDSARRKALHEAKLAELEKIKARCGAAWGNTGWDSVCRDLVRERLTIPKSADFAMMGAIDSEDPVKCTKTYSSTVESKNAFGVEIENSFRCRFDTKKDRVTLEWLGR